MDLQTELYDVGARNFLFINVPPLPKPLSRVGRNASGAYYNITLSPLLRLKYKYSCQPTEGME